MGWFVQNVNKSTFLVSIERVQSPKYVLVHTCQSAASVTRCIREELGSLGKGKESSNVVRVYRIIQRDELSPGMFDLNQIWEGYPQDWKGMTIKGVVKT